MLGERKPLSEEAREARRPPTPWILVDAIQWRPIIIGKARLAHAQRVPRRPTPTQSGEGQR